MSINIKGRLGKTGSNGFTDRSAEPHRMGNRRYTSAIHNYFYWHKKIINSYLKTAMKYCV